MRRRGSAAAAAVGLLLLFGPAGGRAAERCVLDGPALASVLLVQNSGWMEPFFDDPRSPFRPLLKALAAAVAPPNRGTGGTDVVVAEFNQDGQVPGRRSPLVRYCGRDDPAAIGAAVDAIDLPRQPNGAYADADLDGALVGTVNGILGGHPGIVWLVTNNRNSRNNSQRVDDNTRAFADRLEHTAALPAAVAYPLRVSVRGRDFSETGLVVYGIAYGEAAAAALVRVVRSEPVRQLFPEPAVRLKPLDQAPLVFTPDAAGGDGVRADTENGILVIRNVPGGRASTVTVAGSFRSNYYPQVIERAAVSAEWRDLSGLPVAGAVANSVEPAELRRLAPDDVLPGVRIRLSVPAVPRRTGWAGLLQDDVAVSGTLAIRLTGVQLGLDRAFTGKMAQVAALNQLPGVFFDFRGVSAAETTVPVRLVVRFSPWPLVAALGLLALLLLLAAALLWLLRRAREQVVVLDGEPRRMRLRPFERREVAAGGGRRFAVRGGVFGAAAVTALDPPAPRDGAGAASSRNGAGRPFSRERSPRGRS